MSKTKARVFATAFALFQVPYIALSAELTDSPAERSTLMAVRVAWIKPSA